MSEMIAEAQVIVWKYKDFPPAATIYFASENKQGMGGQNDL
jgi:hypothetical protein